MFGVSSWPQLASDDVVFLVGFESLEEHRHDRAMVSRASAQTGCLWVCQPVPISKHTAPLGWLWQRNQKDT